MSREFQKYYVGEPVWYLNYDTWIEANVTQVEFGDFMHVDTEEVRKDMYLYTLDLSFLPKNRGAADYELRKRPPKSSLPYKDLVASLSKTKEPAL